MSAATHSTEWHALRSQGIGGSEIATLAGVGPERSSRYAIWAEKVGLLPSGHVTDTPQMRRGRRVERILVEEFTEETGLYVAGEQTMVSHPTMPWVRNTLDGLVFEAHPASWDEQCLDIGDALGPLELKRRSADGPYDDGLPLDIEAQVQWQLLATQMTQAWVAVLHAWDEFRVYVVERDEEAIAALLAVGHDFWHEHVLANVPPPLGGHGREATAGALKVVYGGGGGGEVELDHMAERLAALRILKADAKAVAEQITDLENEVRAALGDAEVGLVAGRPLVRWTPTARKEFNRKAHEAAHPDCHAAFVTETESRRLDVRIPCPHCPAVLRPQDEAKHMKKHPTEGDAGDGPMNADSTIGDERAEAAAAARDAADEVAADAASARREADADPTLGRCRNQDRHTWGYCTTCGYGMSTGT